MGFLSNLFGGGSKKSSAPTVQGTIQPYKAAEPPPFPNIPTTGFGGMGYNTLANPMGMGSAIAGQGLAAPSWMSGNFSAPWWGQQAPNVGAAMLQQQDPQAYAKLGQPPPVPQQPAPQQDTNPLGDLEQFKAWQQAVNKLTPRTTFSFDNSRNGMSSGLPSVTKTSVSPQNSYSDYLNALAAQQMNAPAWQIAQDSRGQMGTNGVLGFDPGMVGVNALYGLQ